LDLSELSNNPNRHPWELSRAKFILHVLEDQGRLGPEERILDIGAGDLYFAVELHKKTGAPVDAVDTAFQDSTDSIPGVSMFKNLDDLPGTKYRAICALDVLEHVPDDEALLNRLISMLEPDGILMITVPAFQLLFSFHDLRLKHFRRYHRGHLMYLIQNPSQVSVKESFYFFHILFFVRVFQKMLEFFFGVKPKIENSHTVSEWKHHESHPVTRGIGRILNTDAHLSRWLARIGIRIPGLSLCMVLKKTS
jgi:SAM-dependent methyltransferase